jgi:hypothetical protein
MVFRTLTREAGPQERWPKVLKTKLTQVGPSGSRPLRSDGNCDDQAGPLERSPKTLKRELENNCGKPRDLVGKLA